MHESAPVLKATKRERLGSRYSRRVRETGGLPAVMFGHGQEPVSISLDAREASRHIHKGEKVYTVEVSGGETHTVLLKGVQFDYLGSRIIHADFARVDLNERVKTKVPVRFVGEAVGLKTAGAIMMHPTSEIEIECAVRDLPEFVEVTVTALEAGGSIMASQIPLPVASMKLVSDPEGVVAHIVIQQEAPAAEATPADATASQPEVIKKEKKAEDADAAPAKGGAAKAEAPKKDAKK